MNKLDGYIIEPGKIKGLKQVKHNDGTASLFLVVKKENGIVSNVECAFYSLDETGFKYRNECVKYLVGKFVDLDIKKPLTLLKASSLLNSLSVNVIKDGQFNFAISVGDKYFCASKFYKEYTKNQNDLELN